MLVYFAFLALICVSFASDSVAVQGSGSGCGETGWVKISPHIVCLETKNNRYGSFNNYVQAGMVSAIKLEYVSGEVRCTGGVENNSRWGCYGYAPYKDFPLDIVVTDDNNNLLFPKQEFIKSKKDLFYWSPFVNVKDSKEIVFTDYRMPFYFPLYKEMRIWYGQDLMGSTEENNAGRLCVNVYAKFKL